MLHDKNYVKSPLSYVYNKFPNLASVISFDGTSIWLHIFVGHDVTFKKIKIFSFLGKMGKTLC